MQRDYMAPPERVFEAWTDVTVLRRWFGCGLGMLWNVHEWDVRVGGGIHVSLTFDQGPFEVRGPFLVVEALPGNISASCRFERGSRRPG